MCVCARVRECVRERACRRIAVVTDLLVQSDAYTQLLMSPTAMLLLRRPCFVLSKEDKPVSARIEVASEQVALKLFIILGKPNISPGL